MQKFLNEIICGDCIEILGKTDGPFADLIFADPPFNIGYKYDKYHDKVKSKNYIAWTRDWMAACKKVLKPAGSFYIAIGDDYAANVKIIAKAMIPINTDLGLINVDKNFFMVTKCELVRTYKDYELSRFYPDFCKQKSRILDKYIIKILLFIGIKSRILDSALRDRDKFGSSELIISLYCILIVPYYLQFVYSTQEKA